MKSWVGLNCGCRSAVIGVFLSGCVGTIALADTWAQPKGNVEWAFKLGAVLVALEKCPFKKGARFDELETNAKEITPQGEARGQQEGRDFMLILDGSDASLLCGTAYKFFGAAGEDLGKVLALKTPAQTD